MLKITYINTLYNYETSRFVHDEITFKNGAAYFHSGGHGYMIELKYIVKIETVDD